MNNIAIFGYGIVGKGVKDIIDENYDEFCVKKVFDLPSKRDVLGNLLETDMDKIFADAEIDTIVECMGGDELPHEIITKALKAKKNVVSSNKETLSRHMKEYLDLANDNHVKLAFEASVGGGIPLIYPITIQNEYDEIYTINGILNATCNFVLSKMQKEDMSLEDAILLAQKNGFAEKDPSADLKGLDMVRKGNVIATIVCGKELMNDEIPHFGIENVSKNIINYIKSLGRELRFVVNITFLAKKISLVVLPIAITCKNPLIHVEYDNNGVLIEDKHNGPITLLGKGAGRYPTASAIMQDLVRIQKGLAFNYEKVGPYQKIVPNLTGSFLCFKEDKFITELVSPTQDELLKYDFVCRIEK